MHVSRERELAEIEGFLAEGKQLRGGLPIWDAASRPKELTAFWVIEDELGISRGQLRFRCQKANRSCPSISLIFRANSIWRLDIVEPVECKPNPPWAHRVGAPPRVCGPHCHEWSDNRGHLVNSPKWDLPCRRPLPAAVRRLPQALPWLAVRINLLLTPEQRGFDVPPQSELF